jgi:hypothetical protein
MARWDQAARRAPRRAVEHLPTVLRRQLIRSQFGRSYPHGVDLLGTSFLRDAADGCITTTSPRTFT